MTLKEQEHVIHQYDKNNNDRSVWCSLEKHTGSVTSPPSLPSVAVGGSRASWAAFIFSFFYFFSFFFLHG